MSYINKSEKFLRHDDTSTEKLETIDKLLQELEASIFTLENEISNLLRRILKIQSEGAYLRIKRLVELEEKKQKAEESIPIKKNFFDRLKKNEEAIKLKIRIIDSEIVELAVTEEEKIQFQVFSREIEGLIRQRDQRIEELSEMKFAKEDLIKNRLKIQIS